jgi:nitrite reductase/ring-hydroxylating ferredoxin subunit
VNRVRVARVSEVAEGQGIVVEVGGKRIALFCYQGDFFALDETCPHRGGPLHEGLIQDGVVACPWHLWLFDLKTGVSPVNPLSRVSTYSLTIQGEEIWLELR